MRTTINTGAALYHPNTVGGGCPMLASPEAGAYVHHMERVEGHKIRQRSESFKEHFGQAGMFFRSLSRPEQQHLIEACQFELGKVERREIRERVAELFARIDGELATAVAAAIGVTPPRGKDGPAKSPAPSPALSMAGTVKDTVKGRSLAALVAPGVHGREVMAIKQELEKAGARLEVVAPALGPVATADGGEVEATRSLLTVKSVLFDAVVVPGGARSMEALRANGDARDFVGEAYKHCKAVGAVGEGIELLRAAGVAQEMLDAASGGDGAPGNRLGLVVARDHDIRGFAKQFAAAVAQHRHWERAEAGRPVPEANRARGRAR